MKSARKTILKIKKILEKEEAIDIKITINNEQFLVHSITVLDFFLTNIWVYNPKNKQGVLNSLKLAKFQFFNILDEHTNTIVSTNKWINLTQFSNNPNLKPNHQFDRKANWYRWILGHYGIEDIKRNLRKYQHTKKGSEEPF